MIAVIIIALGLLILAMCAAIVFYVPPPLSGFGVYIPTEVLQLGDRYLSFGSIEIEFDDTLSSCLTQSYGLERYQHDS